jgi:replicative DNA helicase
MSDDPLFIDPYQLMIDDCEKARRRPAKIIKTFSRSLNREFDMDGIESGNVMLIMAAAHVGKTYFVLNWMEYLLKQTKLKSLFLSLDMEYGKITNRLYRLIFNCSRKEAEEIKKGYDGKEKQKMSRLIDMGFPNRLTIVDSIMISDMQYKSRLDRMSVIDRLICQTRPDIVFIDHLFKMTGNGSKVYEESRNISSHLKRMKVKYEAVFVVLWQLSKEFIKDHKKIPTMEKGKGAGEIYGAERVFRENLALDPRNSYARGGLEIIRRRRGGTR